MHHGLHGLSIGDHFHLSLRREGKRQMLVFLELFACAEREFTDGTTLCSALAVIQRHQRINLGAVIGHATFELALTGLHPNYLDGLIELHSLIPLLEFRQSQRATAAGAQGLVNFLSAHSRPCAIVA